MCLNNRHTESKAADIENNRQKDLYQLLENDDDPNPLLDNCLYYEPSQISNLNGNKFNLRILHLNIHSIPSKMDDLINLLEKLKDVKCIIDIILLCETLINENTNMSRCSIPGYVLNKQHRLNMAGGGVAI